MTKREGAVLTAFTGIILCDATDLHRYVEELLGRKVPVYELAEDKISEEIRLKSKPEALEIIANQN